MISGEYGFLIQNLEENHPPDTSVDGAALSAGKYLYQGADLSLGSNTAARVVLEHTFGVQTLYFRLGLSAESIPVVERVIRLRWHLERLLRLRVAA